MGFIKKTGAAFLLLWMISAEITGELSQAAFERQQIIEGQAGTNTENLKTAYGEFGLIDSTGKYEYALDPEGNAVILNYLKEERKVQIPSAFDGHPVTVIGHNAFYSNEGKRGITSIQIPDTVTEIQKGAFLGTGIKEVILPDSVIRIAESAFEGCRELKKVFISKSVEEIAGNVFLEADKLTEIEVDSRNDVFTSVDGILYNKEMTEILTVPGGRDLAGFQFPDSVEVIGRSAFAYCKNMERMVLGRNVENIGPSAFLGCNKLSEVILDNSLKVIGRYAFRGCSNLVEVNIPNGTREIGEWSFCRCRKLTKIAVPKSVTYIGTEAIGFDSLGGGGARLSVYIIGYEGTAAYNYANRYGVAFQSAETIEEQTDSLESFYGGVGVIDSMGNYEYAVNEDGTAKIIRYLEGEREVTVPSELDGRSVTAIGEYAFAYFGDPVARVTLPNTVTDIGEGAFRNTAIREMVLPDSVIRIGDDAFGGCVELEKFFISRNVEEIMGNILNTSRKLTTIEVDTRNAAYASVEGVLYNKDVTEVLEVPGGKDMTGFQLPESVVRIGEDAFEQCDNETFTEITIPDRVTKLGAGAFHSCRCLEKVVIGKGITAISGAAFMECWKLRQVIIHGEVSTIGANAFLGCGYLTEIDIPESVVGIGDAAFEGCGSLKNITIPRQVTMMGNGSFGYHEDGKFSDVFITSYKDTVAYRYAKEHYIAFMNAETDETIRFDWIPHPVRKGKITVLTAGKKKIKLEYDLVEDASYRIAVKMVGAPLWKKYDEQNHWKVIKGLKSGKQYKVKVRAWREIDGKRYYGKWSKVKKVTVR